MRIGGASAKRQKPLFVRGLKEGSRRRSEKGEDLAH